MGKAGFTAPRKVMRFAAAVAAFVALPALPGHTVEESKSETIGPWEIEAVFDGDKFDRCAIHRPVRDGIVVRFVRTADGLSLELESPNWKLERGKNYPVKMNVGPLSFDTEVVAAPNSVSMDVKDKKFADSLRSANALNVVAAGATIRVPLDQSTAAFERLDQCVEKNSQVVEANLFCGSDTSAVTAGVSEGQGPECPQETKAEPDTKPGQESKASTETKRAKRVKARNAGSRRIPAFLRRVDLLFQGRQ